MSTRKKEHKDCENYISLLFLTSTSQLIFGSGFDSLPDSDIPDGNPTIVASASENSDAQTPELLLHFGLDFAKTDLPSVAPDSIREIFAKDGPSRIVVTRLVVRADKLVRSRTSLRGPGHCSLVSGTALSGL